MKEIYTRATTVLVWLGLPAENSNTAVDYLRRIANPRSTREPWNEPIRKALLQLCNREYWSRMWILHEVSLARHLLVHCGSKTVDWHAFIELYTPHERTPCETLLSPPHLLREFAPTPTFKLIELREHRPANKKTRLLDLIKTFGDSHCTDLRGKIFALLSLATDCIYVADYTKSVFEIYQDIMIMYFPMLHRPSKVLHQPLYQTQDAVKFSIFLQSILGGPFDIPLDMPRLYPIYVEIRPKKNLIEAAKPTEREVWYPKKDEMQSTKTYSLSQPQETTLHIQENPDGDFTGVNLNDRELEVKFVMELPTLLPIQGSFWMVVDRVGIKLSDIRKVHPSRKPGVSRYLESSLEEEASISC